MAVQTQNDGVDIELQTPSMLERIVFDHRGLMLVVFGLMTLIMAFLAPQLKLNADFDRMIPTGHPYVINMLRERPNLAAAGNALRISVTAKEGTIYNSKYLETLRQVSDEVYLLSGVDRAYMMSLWMPTVRWQAVVEEGITGGPVIPSNFQGTESDLEELRSNVARAGIIGKLVSNDQRSSMILLPLLDKDPESGLGIDYQKLSESLENIRTKFEANGVEIRVIGFGKIVGDLIDGMGQIIFFFLGSVLVAAGALYVFSRCVRSTLTVVICSLVGVVWQLGFLVLLEQDMDPYSILVPFLIFAIGMSHGAQKMNGVMLDVGRGRDRVTAARFTLRRLFVAGLTALISDAFGFAVLLVIAIGVIQQLAVAASIGVLALVFTNLIALPLILSFVGVDQRAAARAVRQETKDYDSPGRHPVWHALSLFTTQPFATAAIGLACILGVTSYLHSKQLRIGDIDPGASELRVDSRYNTDNAFITSHFSASSDLFVVMVKTPAGACSNAETLRKVDDLEWGLQALPGVESTYSLASLAMSDVVAQNEGNFKWYGLPSSQPVLNGVASRAPRELFNQNCDFLAVYVNLRDHKADTLTDVATKVESFAAINNTKDVHFLLAAGNSGVEAATNMVVKKANQQMLLFVYLVVAILCFVTFRSWRAVLVAILPLILTSVMAESVMVMLGIGLKVATLPVVALGVGIGVDYALYILAVMLAAIKSGDDLATAYYKTMLFTGRVVVLTGITLAFGVITWVLSPIKFQADMGIMLAFMFLWNMLGAMILIPALSYFLLSPRKKIIDSQSGNIGFNEPRTDI